MHPEAADNFGRRPGLPPRKPSGAKAHGDRVPHRVGCVPGPCASKRQGGRIITSCRSPGTLALTKDFPPKFLKFALPPKS